MVLRGLSNLANSLYEFCKSLLFAGLTIIIFVAVIYAIMFPLEFFSFVLFAFFSGWIGILIIGTLVIRMDNYFRAISTRNHDDETAFYEPSSSVDISDDAIGDLTIEWMKDNKVRKLNLGSREFTSKIRTYIIADKKLRAELLSPERFVDIIQRAKDKFDYEISDEGKPIAIPKKKHLIEKIDLIGLESKIRTVMQKKETENPQDENLQIALENLSLVKYWQVQQIITKTEMEKFKMLDRHYDLLMSHAVPEEINGT